MSIEQYGFELENVAEGPDPFELFEVASREAVNANIQAIGLLYRHQVQVMPAYDVTGVSGL